MSQRHAHTAIVILLYLDGATAGDSLLLLLLSPSQQNWISRIARVCRVSNVFDCVVPLPHPHQPHPCHTLTSPTPATPSPAPPLAPSLQNDISSSVLSGPGRLGGTADTSSDRQQFFPMTFVKARVSCQIPAQTNADLPHSFDRISELSRCTWGGQYTH